MTHDDQRGNAEHAESLPTSLWSFVSFVVPQLSGFEVQNILYPVTRTTCVPMVPFAFTPRIP